jgi:hypothetical protein
MVPDQPEIADRPAHEPTDGMEVLPGVSRKHA